MEMPAVPVGNGAHPIPLIVISANTLDASTAFYTTVFGWRAMPMSADLTAMATASGPNVTLRANVPAGFPGVVPYIGVPNVRDALERVTAAGAAVERAPWEIPHVGDMALFRDSSGTIYGLTNGSLTASIPHIPMPFGDNPRPAVATICSLEMYAASGETAAQFFGEQFGWGSLATMAHYMAFDPGAGVCGVFQSHTPAAPALAYVYVADVAVSLNAIEAASGNRMGDAMPMPGMGCFGYFTDPSGTAMGLIGP